MELKKIQVGNKTLLQIDDCRICYRNFSGVGSMYNPEGKRSFSVVIPNDAIREQLENDVNQYGIGWNVKLKVSNEEGNPPFMHMPVKVNVGDNGPAVYIKSGNKTIQIDPRDIGRLDKLSIASVDLDIRPYDDVFGGRPFRSAYLEAIWVTQNTNRFAERFAAEEYPED